MTQKILAKIYQETMLGTDQEHSDFEQELRKLQQRYDILVEIRNVKTRRT